VLTDGRWLLIGGTAHPGELRVFDPARSTTTDLPIQLAEPRSGHTATLMPDGTVLVVGGKTTNGWVTIDAEQFDPNTGSLVSLGDIGLEARAEHAATVLSSGRLLVLGGVGPDGQALSDVEVYDPRESQVELLASPLDSPRIQPTATLLPSGTVLISQGVDAAGRSVATSALFDPESRSFVTLDASAAGLLANTMIGAAEPQVVFSEPRLGGVEAPVSGPIAVRFGNRMMMSSLNAGSVTLVGPNGVTTSTVVPAGDGLLLFVTPDQDLIPGSNYTLFVKGAADSAGRPLAFTAVPFTTANLGTAPAPGDASTSARQASALGSAPASTAANSSVGANPNSTRSGGGSEKAANPAGANRGGPSTRGVDSDSSGPSKPSVATKNQASTASDSSTPAATSAIDERWVPTAANYNLHWRSGHKEFSRQSMPQNDLVRRALYGHPEVLAVMSKLTPSQVASGAVKDLVPREKLHGSSGVTAVAGQVLKLNGLPLGGVTLSIGQRRVRSDLNGEFTLADVPSGHQVLVIDGTSANVQEHQYGRFEYGLNVVAGETTVLPFVIWLPALDTQDAVNLSSPTAQPTVVTNPEIPGLELRIPAGTVIRNASGKIVTRITMTAIPTDQPPFPLPGFPIPTYFTIQPGGAHLEGVAGKVTQGAQLIYPNFTHSKPGARMTFWNYDATGKGWYVYGQGTVTNDGRQVMPDAGVVIYEFSGAMVSLPSNAPDQGPNDCSNEGDPVDCSTGLFVNDEVDLMVADVIPLEVRRTYRQRDNTSRAFGIGINLSYDIFNVGTSNVTASSNDTYTYQDLILPNGRHIHYPRVSPGTSFSDAVYQTTSTPGAYFGSIIKWGTPSGCTGPGCGWTLTLRDGTIIVFPDSDGSGIARCAAANGIIDRNGNHLTMTRDGNCNLTRITSPNGRHLNFTYDVSNRITQVSDDIGRTVQYSYDAGGRLSQVTDPAGNLEKFTYDNSNNLLTYVDKRGNTRVQNTYDSGNRVVQQTYADGTTSSFAYTLDGTGTTVTQTAFTDQRGSVKQIVFDGNGYPSQVTRAQGRPEQQVYYFSRDPNTELLSSVTDPMLRTTSFVHDVLGNVTQVTRLAGTANAVSIQVAYDMVHSQPTQFVDENGNATTLALDVSGNVIKITDPLGNNEQFTYDAQGRPLTATDGNGNATTLSYYGGDLRAAVDALGNRESISTDIVGRAIGITNSIGATTALSPNVLDDITSATNPIGGQIGWTYDSNRNPLTVSDQNRNVTTYTYNLLNRVSSRTDSLSAAETYAYEPGGLISAFTDRKGQLTGWSYDGLGRPTQIGFGATASQPTSYTATVGETWDAGDRLTQIVDSVSGTIARTYDGLDCLRQETTPQGTVSYTCDAAGRRTSMSVTGQPTVTYTWDPANRLTQVQQAAGVLNGNSVQTLTLQYDSGDRLIKLTLGNGVSASYSYDSANHVLGVTYTQSNGTIIGNVTYTYDGAGQRISVGGSLANVTRPTAPMTGVYNTENRLTQLNGAAITYDGDGNTLSSGGNTFAWDARGRLSGISGGVAASFAYDTLGRRTAKTINGVTTGFLYDGLTFVQEQGASGTPTAAILAIGIDGILARMTAAGISTPLTDVLGSVIAETNSAQSVATTFSYDPYGNTTQTGASTGNTQQYTARENDGSGLYYYRARYYSPASSRFISEDPAGFAGGTNFYSYVEDNPMMWTDPLGLRPLTGTEKCRLTPYIPKVDLDNADLHDGKVPWYLGKDYDGITRGNDIYFRPGVYAAGTDDGTALLGHELVHVGQYRNGMNWLNYLWSTRKGYENSPYEKAAYAMQDRILQDLKNGKGSKCECQ